ncbi:MAG: hypothetical protein ABF271_01155 [Abyssibacter sp.]|uniref:hypothetical protein n=1 Tax=Abyssibacter sp. TaxID=2320200 RepID=UPI003219A3AF
MRREQVWLDLDHPSGRLQRWMYAIGVVGAALSLPALLCLLGLIAAVLLDAVAMVDAAPAIKWACRVGITGLLMSAIGFWNR